MVKKLKDNNENKDKPRKDFTYEAPKEDPYKIYGECFTKSTESFGNGKYYAQCIFCLMYFIATSANLQPHIYNICQSVSPTEKFILIIYYIIFLILN
mgnify:FL=1|jgi:hypothetical protein